MNTLVAGTFDGLSQELMYRDGIISSAESLGIMKKEGTYSKESDDKRIKSEG